MAMLSFTFCSFISMHWHPNTTLLDRPDPSSPEIYLQRALAQVTAAIGIWVDAPCTSYTLEGVVGFRALTIQHILFDWRRPVIADNGVGASSRTGAERPLLYLVDPGPPWKAPLGTW